MVTILFITVNSANLRDLIAATGLGILLKQKEVFLELLGRSLEYIFEELQES